MTDQKKMDAIAKQAKGILLSESAAEYDGNYQGDFLTMYRDYVKTTDNISSKREKANAFFLTINTGFIGASAYFDVTSVAAAYIQSFIGLLFCVVWWFMIQSYKTLNGSKFEVIQLMEQELPLAPFAAEEFVQNNGPQGHRNLTTIEKFIPMVFIVLHILSAIFLINIKS